MNIITKKRVKKEEDVCNICCRTITAVLRRNLECLYCGFKACNECCKQYLLKTADAHCMNCKKLWNREFLKQNFTKVFVNDHLEHHHTRLFMELEKSLFPETLEYISEQVREQKQQELTRKTSVALDVLDEAEDRIQRFLNNNGNNQFGDWVTDLSDLQDHANHLDFVEESAHVLKKFTEYELTDNPQESSRSIYGYMRDLKDCCRKHNLVIPVVIQAYRDFSVLVQQYMEKRLLTSIDGSGKKKKQKLIRCMTNKCPGYLVNDTNPEDLLYFCKICKVHQCTECLLACTDLKNHECDPETVKTIKLIKRHSKPCPSCKQPIEKNTGCDQMFCTLCHTAFDWESNTIIQGRVHNPHYFEWMKNKPVDLPIEPPQGECGVSVWNSSVYRSMVAVVTLKDHPNLENILSLYEIIQHVIGLFIEPYANHLLTIPDVNRSQRISVLRGDRTVEDWEKMILANRKQNLHKEQVFFIYDALEFMVRSIMEQLHDELVRKHSPPETHEELFNNLLNQCFVAVDYFNTHMRKFHDDLKHKIYPKILKPFKNFSRFRLSPKTTILRNEHDCCDDLPNSFEITEVVSFGLTPPEQLFFDFALKLKKFLDVTCAPYAPPQDLIVLQDVQTFAQAITTLIAVDLLDPDNPLSNFKAISAKNKEEFQRNFVVEFLESKCISYINEISMVFFKFVFPMVRDVYWTENTPRLLTEYEGLRINYTSFDLDAYYQVFKEDLDNNVIGSRPSSYFSTHVNLSSGEYKNSTLFSKTLYSLGLVKTINYTLPRSMGLHTTVHIHDLEIEVPSWFVPFLYEKNLKILQTVWKILFSTPLLSAYINQTPIVSLLELLVIPYVYKDTEMVFDDWESFDKLLEIYRYGIYGPNLGLDGQRHLNHASTWPSLRQISTLFVNPSITLKVTIQLQKRTDVNKRNLASILI